MSQQQQQQRRRRQPVKQRRRSTTSTNPASSSSSRSRRPARSRDLGLGQSRDGHLAAAAGQAGKRPRGRPRKHPPVVCSPAAAQRQLRAGPPDDVEGESTDSDDVIVIGYTAPHTCKQTLFDISKK